MKLGWSAPRLRAVVGRGRALNGRGPVRRAKDARLRPQIAPATLRDGRRLARRRRDTGAVTAQR